MVDKSSQIPAKKRGARTFRPEIMYPFWAAAGGNVQEAMRKAKEAGEKRVPANAHTWADYARTHDFAARLKKDEDDRWAAYHAERERNQQRVLDTVAHGFEELAGALMKRVMDDIKLLTDLDETKKKAAEGRLTKMFGTMDAVDKFYRMYLRARGEPEKITKLDHSGAVPVTYGNLEAPKPTAKTPEEARKLAEGAR